MAFALLESHKRGEDVGERLPPSELGPTSEFASEFARSEAILLSPQGASSPLSTGPFPAGNTGAEGSFWERPLGVGDRATELRKALNDLSLNPFGRLEELEER